MHRAAFTLCLALTLAACGPAPEAPRPEPVADATAEASQHDDAEPAGELAEIWDALPAEVRLAIEAARSGQAAGAGPIVLEGEAAASLQALLQGRAEAQRGRWLGQPLPMAGWTDLDGRAIALEGQRAVVNFWATWCKPCLEELPWFEALDAEDNGLRVITVNNDRERAPLDAYLAQTALALPVVFDPDNAIAKELEVRAWPTSFLLDAEGRVEDVFNAVPDIEALRAVLRVP